MSAERVLISTHDLPLAGKLKEGFGREGYDIELVTPGERLDGHEAALLVLTGGVTREGGANPLARQAREGLHVPVFAIADQEELRPALRPGFDEVFPRSVPVADVVLVGRGIIERRRLRRVTGIVGQTDAMHQVLERVVQIAPVRSTVLVTGESGTGKELIARGIHALSPRRHKPFIAVNVAALSETLLESELFGHEKGAFTGAIDSRRGLFELASGGTIFLDEIGEMPLATQTKLLRVLEQREFMRVGGERSIKVDVRVVTATNQDLRQLVAIGEFRRDLYFRLNVLSIELPPLRERREDIPLLIEAFVKEVSESHDLEFPGISAEAMDVLMAYVWPGNVRELRNLVESMVVLAHGRMIRPEDIPDDVRGRRGQSLLPATIPRAASGRDETRELRPELEFVFRTLVELRVDLDDLRRDFEAYRQERPALHDLGGTVLGRLGRGGGIEIGPYAPGDAASRAAARALGTAGSSEGASAGASEGAARASGGAARGASEGAAGDSSRGEADGSGAGDQGSELGGGDPGSHDQEAAGEHMVIFRPGLTMDEMERRAIAAALAEVDGNRRKAAELLGIGERTLYRKISKYELED